MFVFSFLASFSERKREPQRKQAKGNHQNASSYQDRSIHRYLDGLFIMLKLRGLKVFRRGQIFVCFFGGVIPNFLCTCR